MLGENNIIGFGQTLHISNTVTKLSFKLKKHGTPQGNVYFKIYDTDLENEQASVIGCLAQNLSSISSSWEEGEFASPVALDGDYHICVLYTNGDSNNYIEVYYRANDVKENENMVAISEYAVFNQYEDADCAYRYKCTYAGIEVYSGCQAYEVVYDSEDSLIDSYCPKDSFSIKEGEDRLAVIDKLLFYTGCQRIFKADGKIHVFVPTITGTTYDSEYSLASGHPFFAKSLRDALVVPNKVFVRSLRDATTKLEGSATSAASYALMPVNDYQRAAVDSNEQATSIATAIMSRIEINAQQGGALVPINCGAELYDYVKVTDTREGDYRVGNIGSITRTYKNYAGRKPEYNMSFSFGRVALKSVRGTRQSNLTSRGLQRRESDGSIPWDDLYNEIVEIEYNLHDINIALGWHEAETPLEKQIQMELSNYTLHVNQLISETTLDEIIEGTTYKRVLSTDISAGHIKLSECIGNLDSIDDGSTYGKVLVSDISSGHILLSSAVKDGLWYSESGVDIDAEHGINIYGTNNALTTRATKTGTIQCYVGSDGKIYAGSGNVVLDQYGLICKGTSYLTMKYGNNYASTLGVNIVGDVILTPNTGNHFTVASSMVVQGEITTSAEIYCEDLTVADTLVVGGAVVIPQTSINVEGCFAYDFVGLWLYTDSIWYYIEWEGAG